MTRIASLILIPLLLACAGPGPPDESVASAGLDLNGVRMIDLSHAYGDDTLFWPTSPLEFEHTELAYG